jgi:phytoene dehydrogenase-like protein
MAHEVVVVGGGIGGLTAAALLAARGIDVCLLERQPEVGGCVTSLEKFDYTFEPTLGIYSCWAEGEIHQRIFSELSVAAPETLRLDPAYVVRLAENFEIPVGSDNEQFDESLQIGFPESEAAARKFYKESLSITELLLRALRKVPDFPSTNRARQLYSLLPALLPAVQLLSLRNHPVRDSLKDTSLRFQRFVELQLETFGGNKLGEFPYLTACLLLNLVRKKPVGLVGGAAALAARLEESIKKSGGRIRLDSPVLRLSYDSDGVATGVDLLSGENVSATKAIISNMTVWDTYGKLIGLNRTPVEMKKRLSLLQSDGAFIIFAGIDEVAAARLPADRLLIDTGLISEPENLIDQSRFGFSVAPREDPRGPEGMRAVTIVFAADVDQWFTYQTDASAQEDQDQLALELGWQIVHAAMPELGADIEVIDTASPRTYYEATRRKLGRVGGLKQCLAALAGGYTTHVTTIPNVFMVGDTSFAAGGLAGASQSALIVANEITQR